ncbi:MAG TPA: hypothetical protein VIU10_02515 [Candidatus Udaeobacter sp.]
MRPNEFKAAFIFAWADFVFVHSGWLDLISDALPFGRLWYAKPDDAVSYAKFYSRSHHAVIRVYDEAGNVIQTHEHMGDFKEW